MKRMYVIAAFWLLALGLMAQNKAQSKPGSLNIVKEIKPAILDIVPGSVQFIDATGNRAIDANETCKVVFKVKNSGMGDGYGCVATISGTGTTNGLTYNSKKLSVIPVGVTQTVVLPIQASMYTQDGSIDLTIAVDEPNGFGTDPTILTVATRAFVAPLLKVTDYTITGSLSSTLTKKKPFDLQVLMQNTQHGLAEDVQVDISVPNGVMLIDGHEHSSFATLTAGQTKSLDYTLIVSNEYSGTSIPVQIKIREKYGKYAENKTINLAFNQTSASAKVSVDEIKQEREEIQIASLTSEVDKNIPQNPTTNSNTFAFIIANENYQNTSFAPVSYAMNDGKIFGDYCQKTLGIPAENITMQTNVTFAGMRSLLTRMKTTAAVNPSCNIIFYYAGHGAPSEATKEAFLIPVDAYQIDPSICINLQQLYDDLKSLQDSRITVFLDACFSGTNRGDNMLAQARGVAIKPKENKVEGNLVVFSAASGDETAWPYQTESHGLFTYFLLKKLQETKGNVTYDELRNYLYANVRRISNNINHKLQTPTVDASANLGTAWHGWRLK